MAIQRRDFLRLAGVGAVGVATGARGEAAEPAAGVVDERTTDVCVVGGSMTGLFAAIRAAEGGKRVVLIERRSSFGGTATQGLVPVLHSLYATDGREQIVGGLTADVISRLVARNEAKLQGRRDKNVYCWMNVAELQLVLDEMAREHPEIETHLETRFVGVETDRPGHVVRAFYEDKSGRHAVRAKFFVDASGDADLVRATDGLRVWRPPKDQLQAHTLCAIVTGAAEVKKVHPDFSFAEVMRPERKAGLRHVYCWNDPLFFDKSLTFLSATRVAACDTTDPGELTAAYFEARRQLRLIVDAANRFFPMPKGERGISFVAIAPALGIRESCHIDSLYRVTDRDILYAKHFEDVAAKGCYRVDIHEGAGLTFRYLDGTEEIQRYDPATKTTRWFPGRWRPETPTNPTYYSIPYRSIVPKGSVNVLAAGRMLDCSRDAFGALRVMVNCNQLGETAGRAAVKAIDEGLSADRAYPGAPVI